MDLTIDSVLLFCVLAALVLLLYRNRTSPKSDVEGRTLLLEANDRVSQRYEEMAQQYITLQSEMNAVRLGISEAQQGRNEVIQFSRDLKEVLVRPPLRGKVGERLLEEMCAQHLTEGQWVRQEKTEAGATTDQGGVDVLLKLGKTNVPVDSKFPRETWQRYVTLLDADMAGMTEPQQKGHQASIEQQFEAFRKAVMKMVMETKAHINPAGGTSDFALMWIPNDAMYSTIVALKDSFGNENMITHAGQPMYLIDAIHHNNVVPISPATFVPMVKIIQAALRNMTIVENLQELENRLRLFEQKLGTFTAQHEKVGQSLQTALAAWEAEGARFNEIKGTAERALKALNEVNVVEDAGDGPSNDDPTAALAASSNADGEEA
jgi:DNA recombination protein RmuC